MTGIGMALVQRTSTVDPFREEGRRQWLERCARELEIASTWEPDRESDPLVGHLDAMVKISADSELLSVEDKRLLRERVRAVKVRVYQQRIDFLLEQAMVVARDMERQAER